MELQERQEFLQILRNVYDQVVPGKGHTVFVSGEAGIGKTALIRTFIQELESPFLLLEGYCDSLYAARPLGPLFDIAPQLGSGFSDLIRENPTREQIFPAVLDAIGAQSKPVILFFEDIQWADTATLDFVRFLARRITQVPCLFILTLRDTELPPGHPFLVILGELPPTDYRKLQLCPLSEETVNMLAAQAGRDGTEVYRLTAGIPYYVHEVLASYHNEIPQTVRDSILSLFHRQFDQTRELWEKVSVIPGRIELEILRQMHPAPSRVVDFCFRAGILIDDGHAIHFKHELFRKTIEESLTPFRRRELHQLVVDAMTRAEEIDVPPARIVHHARLASDTRRLEEYAPKAARQAAALGSHVEAAKFYKLALDNTRNGNTTDLAELYEKYSHECYLTNQIDEAIHALEAAVSLRPDEASLRKGNNYRSLSRLHWFAGDIRKSEELGLKAVALCQNDPESRELALAYSNMSQLMLLSDNDESCLAWGHQAVTLATICQDEEALCHALNNIGMALLKDPAQITNGLQHLNDSLDLALKNQFHDHVARAYGNLGYAHYVLRNFDAARSALSSGIAYCDIQDLHAWMAHMQSSVALTDLKTGSWDRAAHLSEQLLGNPRISPFVRITAETILATISIRKGDAPADSFIYAAGEAARIGELHRVVPVVLVFLESAWLNDTFLSGEEIVHMCLDKIVPSRHAWFFPEVSYWYWKATGMLPEETQGNGSFLSAAERKARALNYLDQIRSGDPYCEALRLSEGNAADQRKALSEFRILGAHATAEKIGNKMRITGIGHIPRGPRSSTLENAAGLTKRQMDVLALLSSGLQNKEIAGKLFVSAKTIDHHISAILAKLDVNSRSKAVARAKELGLL